MGTYTQAGEISLESRANEHVQANFPSFCHLKSTASNKSWGDKPGDEAIHAQVWMHWKECKYLQTKVKGEKMYVREVAKE